ncbi:hypothetical protein CSKR_112661 [Clonorchis sinensis]|uniref:Uncharacterized protein n=1 Tax=Clonorchis sinensis TaxID=79923 RepID=A0A8T1MMS6_CLOSI|nr:hypothetical protein CSKR_112661 [Clonorchis sinensis]
MSDCGEPLCKQARGESEADVRLTGESRDSIRRKQVDAHVQAFLKAVLDRARGSKTTGTSSAPLQKPDQCDATTQTEDHWDVTEQLHNVMSTIKSCKVHEYANGSAELNVADPEKNANVPNRAMYSQETLRLVSQNADLYNRAHVELYSDIPEYAQYYTGLNVKVPDSEPAGHMSSANVRRAITQWMESYEQWFYQNFGVDVKSALAPSQTASHLLSVPSVSTVHSQPFANQTVPVHCTSEVQTAAVVSGAPVSYLVSEGSLYTPENQQFSPYVSLLPSFYTSAAFSNVAPQGMQCIPTSQVSPLFIYPSELAHLAAYQFPNLTSPHTHVSALTTSFPEHAAQVSFPPQREDHLVTFPKMSAHAAAHGGEPACNGVVSDYSVEVQTSAMLAALSLPVSSGRQPTMGQWGPLLRYGTYGRLPSVSEIRFLKEQKPAFSGTCANSSSGDSLSSPPLSPSRSKKMPPPPPTFILLRRQAMICALQLSCRDRARELFYREKENTSGLKLDFVSELERLSEKSINIKPVYLFTRMRMLPASERTYYVSHNLSTSANVRHQVSRIRGFQGVYTKTEPFYGVDDMYLCDLLIGDVLIAEACSTFKVQAQLSAARQAFRVFSQPCFLVGSIRKWDESDYLVLCLSPKAEMVPQLPPFLSDPFESLSKKDRTIQSDENFEVINPKPAEELWIFMANYPLTALDEQMHWDRILAQSAEFSQMTISFEVEVNTENGTFVCSALLDNQRFPPVSSSSVDKAQLEATRELLTSLRKTQPVVGLQTDCIKDSGSLMGVPDGVLVDTLMWGKEELELAIAIEQLEAHCDVPIPSEAEVGPGSKNISSTPITNPKDRFRSARRLDAFLQAYAASSLVTPLRLSRSVVPPNLWAEVRTMSSNWGLLCQVDFPPNTREAAALFVCKRAPLPRLKRTLYDQENYGCLRLLDKGNLSSAALRRLLLSDPLVTVNANGTSSPTSSPEAQTVSPVHAFPPRNTSLFQEEDPYGDEPVTRLARHFIATAPLSNVKMEPESHDSQARPIDDCILVGAELNQPSTAIEILDDLPRTLIPGIDF